LRLDWIVTTVNHYETLGLRQDADAESVRRAYLSQVALCHPDRLERGSAAWSAANERLRDLNEAYSTLKDPKRRAQYDRSMVEMRTAVVHQRKPPAADEAELDARAERNRARYHAALNSEEVISFCAAVGLQQSRIKAVEALNRWEAGPARSLLQRYLVHGS
jgi:curved DNA-binding protein CbpA